MKFKGFLSVFLAVLILMGTAVPSAAAAEEEEEPFTLEDPNILAKAALLVDAKTGAVVYAKDEHKELYPASLTKIMTALLVLEAVDKGDLTLDQPITATQSAMSGLSADGSTAGIKAGETMTVENLLYCMLVVSANEACNILAEAVAGSVDAFVDKMNAKAEELGCENTHFANANGLHDPQHYTSAWDLYLITKAAMEYPEFMSVCDTAQVTIPATNMSEERTLYTTNYLLSNWRVIGYRNTEAHGIKTGSTDEAGYCLVSSAQRGSLSFISVILGAERVEVNGVGNVRSFSETTRMFNWGFKNFTYKTVLDENEFPKEVAVTLSKIDHVAVRPAEEVEVLMPNGLDPADLTRTVELTANPVEAPVSAGDVLGTLTLSYNDQVYATVDLLALNDVEASGFLTFLRDMQGFFSGTAVRIALVVLVVLIAALVLWKLTVGRRRYRYGRSVSGRGRSSYRGRRRR